MEPPHTASASTPRPTREQIRAMVERPYTPPEYVVSPAQYAQLAEAGYVAARQPTPREEFVAKWRANFAATAVRAGVVHEGTYIGPLAFEEWLRLELWRDYDEQVLLPETLRALFGEGDGTDFGKNLRGILADP